tara:strand:+ start:364 stop:993 length:630 start_codon:yes stop_codon:yes gene_type:complete
MIKYIKNIKTIIKKNYQLIIAIIIFVLILNTCVLIKEGLKEEDEDEKAERLKEEKERRRKLKKVYKIEAESNIREIKNITQKVDSIYQKQKIGLATKKEKKKALELVNKGIRLCDYILQFYIFRGRAPSNVNDLTNEDLDEMKKDKKKNAGNFIIQMMNLPGDTIMSMVRNLRNQLIEFKSILSENESKGVAFGRGKKTKKKSTSWSYF